MMFHYSTCRCVLILGILHCVFRHTDSLRQGFAPRWIAERFCRGKHGIMKLPWDCSGYLHCTSAYYSQPSGSWFECGETLQFDGNVLSCVRSPSDCFKGLDVAVKICPDNPDLMFPHPDNCAMFYDCSKASTRDQLGVYENECPDQQMFDPETGACQDLDDLEDDICNNKPATRCDNGRDCTSIDPHCRGKPSGVNPKDGVLFTSEYIVCLSGGQVVMMHCNMGYVFDPVRRECSYDIRESVITYCRSNPVAVFPDSRHCARYYNCSSTFSYHGLNPYQSECPLMHLFDSAHSSCVRHNRLTTPCGSRFEPINSYAATLVSRYTHPIQSPTGPQVCECMKTINQLADTLQNLTSFIDNSFLHLQDQNKLDCGPLPHIHNSKVTISYTNDEYVAVYTCDDGYTVCDGQLNTTCGRYNMWNTVLLGKCVQDTWRNLNNLILSCPPRVNTVLLIRGRSIEDLYTVSLIDYNTGQTHLHMRLRSTSRTVEAGTSLETMKPVTSHIPLTGQIIWTIEFKATTIEISVSDHHVISVPHTSDLSMINSLIISAAFQADKVKLYPNGTDTAVPKKHWSPFFCPEPPLIRRAAVQLSYTKSEALASYTCDDQHAMCMGNRVIHCYNESGWDAHPGSCFKTVLDAGIGGSLSSFPVCPLRLGSGIEMWVTPRENMGVMEICHSKTDIVLRLELTLLDTDTPIALHHVVSDRLSTVKYPISQPFIKGRESRVTITRLSDQLLIEVDGEVLSHYPPHHLNGDKSLFIESTQGLIVRKARIYHDIVLDVIKKPIQDNLALWASVEASSTYANPKFYGVGNPIQSWPTGSCWNTDIGDTKQWYQVDLGRQYYIRDIVIDITTKKSLESFLPVIVADPILGGSQLELTPRNETDNLAFKKVASGSRDADSTSSPAHAVDGDVDSRNCYTSHSSVDNPWWMVDLGREYTISSVAIQGHEDPDSASRLSDIAITIYKSNPRTNASAVSIVCIEKTTILGPFKRLPCVKSVTGQFVMITRTVGVDKEPLTICEVHVFKAIESRLHDFAVNVYEENPLNEEQITKRLCVTHIGEFPKDKPTTLTCAEDVWGRFVRIEADVIRDQYDMMTICEVEIYGDKAVKKEWSHFDCPDPPMIRNAFVKVSHTPTEAVAHYECLDGFTMCKGPSVVTCSSSVGWKDNPGSCLSRTYHTDRDVMDIVHFCPVRLGEAIEIYLTPRETGFLLVLGTDVEAVFTMQWNQDSEIGNIRISTDWTADEQPIYIQGGPFKLNKESKVLITIVTHALHISIDGTSFHTSTISEHLIDTLRTNKATITKMFHLQTNISETMYVPSPDNLAASRPVSTSTALGDGDAEWTVDTDTGTDSCWSSARGDMDVWWTVELETLHYVSHVKLTTNGNCGDDCDRRVHDFQIEMFHLNPSPKDTGDLCLKYNGVLPHASTTTLTCIKKVTGRVLRISAPDRRNPDDLFTLCEVEVFGGSVVKADHGSRNLALFRPVSVSSSFDDVTTVEGVVDGNRNMMYLSNSCWSAAGSDRSPWWLVELDNYYYISHVVITSTEDCGAVCENILQDFTIEVTPAELKPDSQWDVCLQYDRLFQYGKTQTLYCSTSLLGRFMRIQSTGDGGIFTLCEVEVYGGSITIDEVSSTNLAGHRPVSASTRHFLPEWAVDGNHDMDLKWNSCWTTEDTDDNPWWMVELDDYYLVSEVELTSRSDCMRTSCNEELSNFVIEMFHRKPQPGDTGTVCLAYKDVFPHSTTQMLQCKDKAPSRYVRLGILGGQVNDKLTLCEVRVFGAKLNRQGWTPFSCPTPPRHSNAHVQVCHTPDKAVASYTCDTNYTMCTGSEKIFCTSEAGWEGTPGTCVQTTLEHHHGHDMDLSEFPICYPRLGEGFEMWITPKSSRNYLELLSGNSGLRLIITPDNAEETVAMESMHNGIPSDVIKLNMKLFKLHQESHVVFMFLTSGILIKVGDKRLVSYPHHFIHTSSRINYVRSSGGLNIRMVRPVNGYMEGITRVLSDRNLALNKVTRASSMQDDTRHSGNAVDGNLSELGVDSLCWLPSTNDKTQWIMVDLSGFYYIKDIVLYNRVTDGCPQCTGNTQDFIIDVLQTDAADELTSICAVYEGIMPLAATEKISCKDNVWGWYVRIQATGIGDSDSHMSFCEIEVYGNEVIEKDQWSLYDCGVPPTLADASVQVSYSPGRAIANYTCDKHHTMCTGSHIMECSSRAGWEGTMGVCVHTSLELRHGSNIDLDSFSICNLKLGEGIEVLIVPKAFGSSISLMFEPEGDIALQLRITPGHLEGNVHLTTVQGGYYSDVPLTSDLFTLDKEAHVVFIFLSLGIFILVDGEILTIYPHLLTTPKISFIQSTNYMHILMGRTIPRYMDGLSVRPSDENLAILEKTSASSSSPNSDHKHLVDGDISQLDGKCWSPHTGDREQWVRVEMGGYFFIREIILYGRGTHSCVGCAGSTHDFIIDVLASHELTSRCAVYEGVMPLGAVEKIRCEDNAWGRYVRIQATDVRDDNDVMTFCEIQIYGDSINKVL